jgi:hypothetical protein
MTLSNNDKDSKVTKVTAKSDLADIYLFILFFVSFLAIGYFMQVSTNKPHLIWMSTLMLLFGHIFTLCAFIIYISIMISAVKASEVFSKISLPIYMLSPFLFFVKSMCIAMIFIQYIS